MSVIELYRVPLPTRAPTLRTPTKLLLCLLLLTINTSTADSICNGNANCLELNFRELSEEDMYAEISPPSPPSMPPSTPPSPPPPPLPPSPSTYYMSVPTYDEMEVYLGITGFAATMILLCLVIYKISRCCCYSRSQPKTRITSVRI